MSAAVEIVEWQCQLCTYKNNSSYKKCSMCQVNKGVTIEHLKVYGNEGQDSDCKVRIFCSPWYYSYIVGDRYENYLHIFVIRILNSSRQP